MSIAIVQAVQAGHGGASNGVTISSSASGSLLVVMSVSSLNNVTSVTDNVGNTYTVVPGATGFRAGAGGVDIWYSKNSAPGVTLVTINYAISPGGYSIVAECSGTNTTAPVDDGEILDTASAQLSGPVLTLTNGGDVAFSIHNGTNVDATGVHSPWLVFGGSITSNAAYLLNPGTTGTTQAIYTPSTNDSFISAGAAFFPAGITPSNAGNMFLVF